MSGVKQPPVRRLSWALLLAVAAVALVFGATDDPGPVTGAERAAALSATIACPQCDGQPVSESNAPIAVEIRTNIKRQVDDGLSDGEIRASYVAAYGEWVDLQPSSKGLTGVVWIAPFLVIGVAAGGLALAFSRWSRESTMQVATAADHELVDELRDGGEQGGSGR